MSFQLETAKGILATMQARSDAALDLVCNEVLNGSLTPETRLRALMSGVCLRIAQDFVDVLTPDPAPSPEPYMRTAPNGEVMELVFRAVGEPAPRGCSMLPERAGWTDVLRYKRADGTLVTFERKAQRWASQSIYYAWKQVG